MQSERKIHADINTAGDSWIQVTLSGEGAVDRTEPQIEAALSAAEPVAWLVKRYDLDGVLLDTELSFVRPTIKSTCRTDMVPLYAAPPAPSVAVKLDSIAHRVHALARMVGTSFFDDVEKDLRELSATLSAQVQDVAGWHEKCGELLCLIADLTESDGELFDSHDREKINAIDADWRNGCEADVPPTSSGAWQTVPKQPTDDMLDAALAVHETREGEDEEFRAEFKRTYRAMLAAAPAKQEGGESQPVHKPAVDIGESGDE